MPCAVASVVLAKPKRRRVHPRVPTIIRLRTLLGAVPPRRRRLIVEQLMYETKLELTAVAQDAAIDAVHAARDEDEES